VKLPIGTFVVERHPNPFMDGGLTRGFDVELQVDAFDAGSLIGWGIQHQPALGEELGRYDDGPFEQVITPPPKG